MIDSVLALSKTLIAIQSDPGRSRQLHQCLEIVKRELADFTVDEFECDGVESILVYPGSTRPKQFALLLNGHLDVIPAKPSQYKPHIKDGKLYGAGALDMKSNLSCLIHVFKKTASSLNYPIGLQIVTDEEVGGFKGTKYQVDQGVRSNFILAGETTGFNIATRAKGVIWGRVATTGTAAHGAYPWRGENAIVTMNRVIDAILKRFPIPDKEEWISTVNISKISSTNPAHNKVPDQCEITLDVRYIPEDETTIVKAIEKVLPKQASLQIDAKEPCLFTPDNNPSVNHLQRVTQQLTGTMPLLYGAHGTSDARHFTNHQGNGIEFGPIGGGIGSDNEWINIKSLETYCAILERFITEFVPQTS